MRGLARSASAWTGALLLAGCSGSHTLPSPCTPETEAADCAEDEVCRETFDGEQLCMEVCDPDLTDWCPGGEFCTIRLGGVCWPGGPSERGEPCVNILGCRRGLICNRDAVCDETCSETAPCSTPGLQCEYGNCQPPVPVGAPCDTNRDCSPPYDRGCLPEHLYTCQARCDRSQCPDGRSCDTDDRDSCLESDPVAADTCERTPEGSVGCRRPDDVCALTTLGVRRCMEGCPGDEPWYCGGCLPDPENPDTFLCWRGGAIRHGEPCTSHYECVSAACSPEGVCASWCRAEGEPCPTSPEQVCRDHICVSMTGS